MSHCFFFQRWSGIVIIPDENPRAIVAYCAVGNGDLKTQRRKEAKERATIKSQEVRLDSINMTFQDVNSALGTHRSKLMQQQIQITDGVNRSKQI